MRDIACKYLDLDKSLKEQGRQAWDTVIADVSILVPYRGAGELHTCLAGEATLDIEKLCRMLAPGEVLEGMAVSW